MHSADKLERVSPLLRGLRDHSLLLSLFTASMFLSALLLFSVQPVFAKLVLPKLGGSPAVWAVSMVFFQAVLLGGYAYAHLVDRHCAHRHAPLVHLGLMAIAATTLPFALPAFASEPPPGDAYLWLIGVLAVGVGLPFFAVSANAPLLQSWFARSGHPQARDPYFLYGASNLGSLIALLAYPFAIEPVLGLARQASVWTAGFVLLAVAIGLCAAALPSSSAAIDDDAGAIVTPTAAKPVSWSERLGWVWLAAIPSGLLVSFTSFVTTDIASAPFLWVLPLALFLATFVVVFRDPPLLPQATLLRLLPLVTAIALIGMLTSTRHSWIIGIAGGFAAFLVTTLVCNRALYERRPDSRQLTAFYMWMSLGGVLGGMFAALLAPQIFNAIYEFPLLLLAGLTASLSPSKLVAERRDVAIDAGLGLALVALMAQVAGIVGDDFGARLCILVVAAATLIYLRAGDDLGGRRLAAILTMAAAVLLLPSNMRFGHAERSFFGVHRVTVSPDGKFRQLFHGSTLHGAMRIRDDAGKPVAAPLPATYFHPGSPLARGFDVARRHAGTADGRMVIGLVGVGAGSLACYGRAGDDWSFYEIDPVVMKIARDPALFSFFERCQPDPRVVIGDARLTLAKEPAAKFDYLLLDAFASDTVPVHLFTQEALTLFATKMRPDGVMAMHVSNRFMDLAATAAMQARAVPGISAVVIKHRPGSHGFDAVESNVILMARNPAVLAEAASWQGAEVVKPLPPGASEAPWTDDYSNILGAIIAKMMQ